MSRLFYCIGIAIIALGVSAGCDSDEKSFENAPSAKAPSKTAPSAGSRDEPNTQRTDKPTTGEMPADHPPVGAQGQSAQSGSVPPAPGGGAEKRDGTSGPIRWEAPEGWKAIKPASNMRYAEYVIPGESTPLSLTIFYFGPEGGGSVQQNIDRWTGQFDTSAGGSEAEVARREVNGMTVHTVDVAGTYDAGAAMGGGAPKESQRMLGAIVEAPTGNYFIKLVGPQEAVSQHTEEFESFISSFKAAR
jgi:hypothetical protein